MVGGGGVFVLVIFRHSKCLSPKGKCVFVCVFFGGLGEGELSSNLIDGNKKKKHPTYLPYVLTL